MKIVVSYPYLFYSHYQFYKTKDFSDDWPQGWAVSALSAYLFFLLAAIEIELSKYDIVILPETILVQLSILNGYIWWSAIIVCIINFTFFFKGKRWQRYIKRYDALSEDDRIINHCLSLFIIILIPCFYLFEIFTLGYAKAVGY